MDSSMITINNLTKHYGETPAVSALSLSIEKGEKVALIGPSGAGKSTLLNLLSRDLTADTGTITIASLPLEAYPSNKSYARITGVIRQSFDLIPQLTTLQNVLAGNFNRWSSFTALLSLIKPHEKEEAIKSLHRVGIGHKLYDETSKLSGGEKQRVAIARVLIQNPEIILADEPVASLDPSRARSIIELLSSLCEEEHKTLIASLHSVELALTYFDRLIALKDGQLVFDLPANQITKEELDLLYKIEDSYDTQTL